MKKSEILPESPNCDTETWREQKRANAVGKAGCHKPSLCAKHSVKRGILLYDPDAEANRIYEVIHTTHTLGHSRVFSGRIYKTCWMWLPSGSGTEHRVDGNFMCSWNPQILFEFLQMVYAYSLRILKTMIKEKPLTFDTNEMKFWTQLLFKLCGAWRHRNSRS